MSFDHISGKKIFYKIKKYFILFVIKQYIFNVALMNLECLLAEVSQFIVAPKSLSFI